MPDLLSPCPCDSRRNYADCCAPILRGDMPAPTAEALMRSRYTAYVLEDDAYLLRSWHPETRPAHLTFNPDQRWLGLKIKASDAGQLSDTEGTVEFVARYKIHGRGARLHETSRFTKVGGAWVYIDGTLIS